MDIKLSKAEQLTGKSICTCGHLGDGVITPHVGPLGHGRCNTKGCECEKFTWARFAPWYQEKLDEAKEGEGN